MEALTGRKVDYKRDVRVGFGDYVQIKTKPTKSSSMEERTRGCIALYPVGSLTGTHVFFSLDKGTKVRADHFVRCPTPDIVISAMNNYVVIQLERLEGAVAARAGANRRVVRGRRGPGALAEEAREGDPGVDQVLPPDMVVPNADAWEMGVLLDEREEQQEAGWAANEPEEAPQSGEDQLPGHLVEEPDATWELPGGGDLEIEDEDGDPGPAEETLGAPEPVEVLQEAPEKVTTRRSGRERRRSQFLNLHVSVKKAQDKWPELADESALTEVRELWERRVLFPVSQSAFAEMSERKRKRLLKSFSFFKEKLRADGSMAEGALGGQWSYAEVDEK